MPSLLREQKKTARRIQNYWREKGYSNVVVDVVTTIVTVPDGSTRPFHEIRSNLFNGLPVG